MAHTYEQLKHMTVADLRDLAKVLEHEAVEGYTQMNKDHLVPALCKAYGIDTHEHHDVVGLDKKPIKDKIKLLKVERKSALEAHDHAKLKSVRRRIHSLKRRIRAATV